MTIKNYIQRYVLLKIRSNEWEKNEKIPSENQLAIKFNCSRITARQALIPLVDSGFLKVIKGKGYIVSEDSGDSNLRSFIERYSVTDTTLRALKETTTEIVEILEVSDSDRFILFEKKYYDEVGLLACQKTFLNNEYIWEKNLDGFAKSITKELALQGAPITNSSMEVKFMNLEGMNIAAREMGYFNRFPLEIVKSYSEEHWIEKTVRIVRPDKFRISYSKTKFS